MKNYDKERRILINAVSSKMGGALAYLKNLVTEIERSDFRNKYIICIPSQCAREFSSSDKIRFLSMEYKGSYIKRLWWDQITVRQLIKKEKIHILFSIANYGTLLCPIKQLLLIRAYPLPIPYFKEVIFAKYSLYRKIIFYLKQILMGLSAWEADLVMFPTKSTVDDFKKGHKLSPAKTIINHYGTYLERFVEAAENRPKEPRNGIFSILYLTMYAGHKNFDTLFRALAILKKQGIKFQFITCADMEDNLAKAVSIYDKDKGLLDSLDIKDRVVFTGKVAYEKIGDLYKKADIFVWPTTAESFGHPLVEAMASGLPIVASDILVNKEIGGDAILYFSVLDAEDFAEKIKLLVKNTDLREELAEKAQERSQAFKWEDHVQRLFSAFELLINQVI